MHTYMRLETSI